MNGMNPSRKTSMEPPDSKALSAGDEDVAERGAAPRSRKAAASQGSELVKLYRAFKKSFDASQRKKAASSLAKNKAALEAHLSHRLPNEALRKSLPIPKLGELQTDTTGSLAPPVAAGTAAGGTSALPPNVLKLSLSDRRVTVKPSGSSQPLRAYVRVLPNVQPPPLYTTWSYLKRNELARDHGRRMFLVDSSGETVPADDGENDERLPWENVDGAAVDWAMTRLAEEYGWEDPDVLEALMEALRPRPQPEAIVQRLAYLHRLKLEEEDRQQMEVEEVLDAFVGSHCRRCRIYGCRTHSGGHVKPHHRPAPLQPDTSTQPCGPGCWKAAAGADGGPLPHGAGQQEDGAAGVGDAMDVDDGGDRGGSADTSGLQQAAAAAAAGGAMSERTDQEVAGTPEVAWGHLGGHLGEDECPQWTRYELSLIRQGIQLFGMGNTCTVTLLLGGSRSCTAVKQAMERLGREQRAVQSYAVGRAAATSSDPAGADAAAAGADVSMGSNAMNGEGGGDAAAAGGSGDNGFLQGLSRVPARRKGGRAKKTVLTSKSARSLVVSARAQHGNNDWHEYQPCTCMGKCKADCPCVRARNFCEKFCACSPTCRERFRGCTCKSGCKTNMCPCWAAGRECDPDLCGGCAPTLESRAELGRECHNMRLRLRQHAHVVLGTSDIPGAGWGLFAAQYVAKNGFLGEYTGDLITQDEANRRGSIYDFMNNSYLFNLNNEWVVDAKFRGNKLRCANHSEEPVAKAKVLLVDGESRIAILADKNLAPGMEITYDYRYSDDTAPHWVKKKQR